MLTGQLRKKRVARPIALNSRNVSLYSTFLSYLPQRHHEILAGIMKRGPIREGCHSIGVVGKTPLTVGSSNPAKNQFWNLIKMAL